MRRRRFAAGLSAAAGSLAAGAASFTKAGADPAAGAPEATPVATPPVGAGYAPVNGWEMDDGQDLRAPASNRPGDDGGGARLWRPPVAEVAARRVR